MHSRSQRGLRPSQYEVRSMARSISTERARNRAFVVILASQQQHFEINAAEQLRLHPIPLFRDQYVVTPTAI